VRVSRILIINSLASGISVLLVMNLKIIWPYRHALYLLWEDTVRCITAALHYLNY
jgi:hypothetical protein